MFDKKDILDEALRVGSFFDWITPTIAFIHDFFFAPTADFGIPANIMFGRREIKQLLRQRGIKAWGLMYDLNDDILMFTVRKRDALQTYYVLSLHGIPIYYSPINLSNY